MKNIINYKSFNENNSIEYKLNKKEQPNFYKFKTGVYRILMFGGVGNTMLLDAAIHILKKQENILSYHKKRDGFSELLIEELERMDIRSVGRIVDILLDKVDNKIVKDNIPAKIIKGEYIIDYNDNGFLDLIFN